MQVAVLLLSQVSSFSVVVGGTHARYKTKPLRESAAHATAFSETEKATRSMCSSNTPRRQHRKMPRDRSNNPPPPLDGSVPGDVANQDRTAPAGDLPAGNGLAIQVTAYWPLGSTSLSPLVSYSTNSYSHASAPYTLDRERRGSKGILDDSRRLMMRIGVLLGFVTAAAGFWVLSAACGGAPCGLDAPRVQLRGHAAGPGGTKDGEPIS